MSETRRIAWDAVSFLVPANWDMGVYKFLRKNVTRVEIEDEYSVRLEVEWLRPRRKFQMQNFLSRHESASQNLARLAHGKDKVEDLPAGWSATLYSFRESVPLRESDGLSVLEHKLLSAFFICPDSSLYCSVVLHLLPGDNEDLNDIFRLFTSDFRNYDKEALIPWELFDISFSLPREFTLEKVDFGIGSKLMLFRWKHRRFFLWYLSCADRILKDNISLEAWVAAYLNDVASLGGARFYPGKHGELISKRRIRHPFGHREEIMNGCFKLKARCALDTNKNQIIAWAFSHRKAGDLDLIPETF